MGFLLFLSCSTARDSENMCGRKALDYIIKSFVLFLPK